MKLYVGNLPYTASEADLRDLFGSYGEPQRVTVVTDRASGRSRGFGFVELDDSAAAQAAIEGLNGRDFQGRSLVVNEARPDGGGRGGPRAPRGGGFGGGWGDGGFRGGRFDDRGPGRRTPGGRRGRF